MAVKRTHKADGWPDGVLLVRHVDGKGASLDTTSCRRGGGAAPMWKSSGAQAKVGLPKTWKRLTCLTRNLGSVKVYTFA